MDFTGRKLLCTSEKEITSANVVQVLQKVLPAFNQNSAECDYLHQYYRGNQPILQRTKKVRPEICNRIVENHANEIVSFKKGYTFGEPVQYVRRAVRDEGEQNAHGDNGKEILKLNEIMSCEDKASKDEELSEWFFTCGTSFRMTLPKESDDGTGSDIEIEVLDPRNTGIVYYTGFGNKPLMSIQAIQLDPLEPGEEPKTVYSVYTEKEYFEIEGNEITKRESHILGSIPIIEYPNNKSRLGSFEIVLPLLDAINNADSNRLDGIEQFIQSFMKFVNVQIDKNTYEELKEEGALAFTSEPGCPADVDIVTSELNQTQSQIMVDHLYQMVLIICGMPDRNGTNRASGDTGQAVMLRDGWAVAESKAKETESVFKRSEKQFLKFVMRNSRQLKGLKISDIDIKFTRNKTDNLLTKTQGLMNMLTAGVAPQVAFGISNLFSDPEQACKDSEKYLQKWIVKNESTGEEENSDPQSQRSDKNAKDDREVNKTQTQTEKS